MESLSLKQITDLCNLTSAANAALRRHRYSINKTHYEMRPDEVALILSLADELALPKRNSKPSAEGIVT